MAAQRGHSRRDHGSRCVDDVMSMDYATTSDLKRLKSEILSELAAKATHERLEKMQRLNNRIYKAYLVAFVFLLGFSAGVWAKTLTMG
jgi:hypothetical protein